MNRAGPVTKKSHALVRLRKPMNNDTTIATTSRLLRRSRDCKRLPLNQPPRLSPQSKAPWCG